jgi:nucleoside-diphosphate-sugar epimerase
MPLTDGKQVRDFCAVQDIARAVVTCVEREPKKNIEKFNLGSGQQVPLREMIEQVCEAIGLKTKLEFGKVKRNPLEPSYLVADISHARKELDWEPRIPLAEAVWELAQEVAPQLKLKRPEASA